MPNLFASPTSYWLVLCVALSTVIWIKSFNDFAAITESSVVAPRRSEAKPLPGQLKSQSQSRDLISVIVTRPLFSPSRRPYSSLQMDQPSDDIDIRLMCVLTTETERAALVKLDAQEELIRIHERDFISDWQVEKISAEHLYLRRNDSVRIIPLWPVSSG